MSNRKARLRWQCRRGMLELDALFQPFLEQHFSDLSLAQQNDFERLLEQNDQQLYHWFIGCQEPQDPAFKQLIIQIKKR